MQAEVCLTLIALFSIINFVRFLQLCMQFCWMSVLPVVNTFTYCTCRNRAIHGDFVVVKVSPRNPSTLLDPQDDDSLDLEQPNLPAVGHTGALTSGKVVAVLERRSWERDYVATFAVLIVI